MSCWFQKSDALDGHGSYKTLLGASVAAIAGDGLCAFNFCDNGIKMVLNNRCRYKKVQHAKLITSAVLVTFSLSIIHSFK